MGGPIRNQSAGLGQLSQKGGAGKFQIPMPSISQKDLPVEVIVALMPEMVRGSALGVSPAIVALLGDLRDRFGMQRVEPLWPVGIDPVVLRPIRRGSLSVPLPSSARTFLSNAKMLMGNNAIGASTLSPEDQDQARMRLKLTFSAGVDVAAIVKRIEAVGGVDYAEEVSESETPVLPSISKQKMYPKDKPLNPDDPPFYAFRPWAEWARNEIGWIDNWSELGLVNIAVFDSGVDSTHPSLADSIDFANEESKVDASGHGTFVAGIIAGRGVVASEKWGLNPDDVSDTMNGLLPEARLWVRNVMNPIAVRTNDNKLTYRVDPGRYSNALNQIIKAKLSPKGNARLKSIQVVNLSIGSRRVSKTEQRDIAKLIELDVTIVASVGNHSQDILYPASFKDVIAVGALNYDRSLWAGTNSVKISEDRTTGIDLLAPGEFILSAMPRTPSAMGIPFSGWLTGTSMAAPHVTAVAAVLRSKNVPPSELVKAMSERDEFRDFSKLKCPKP